MSKASECNTARLTQVKNLRARTSFLSFNGGKTLLLCLPGAFSEYAEVMLGI